ncbi:MAG: AAA family ATPase [Bryobacterales bacterium]|nr:AAA family ATPase [Bryobacterales bacterium]
MYGEPVTPLRLVAWLGAGIGKGLSQLWAESRKLGRIMRTEFVRAFEAERKKAPEPARRAKIPVRGFGFFLIGFQAVGLILVPTNEGFFNPVTFGILVASLWSFPSVWGYIPSLFQKLLLLVLVPIVETVVLSLLAMPVFWKLGSAVGLRKEAHEPVMSGLSLVCMGIAWVLILFSRKKPQRAVTVGSRQQIHPVQQQEQRWSNIPSITYADVGGMDRAKERIRSVVQNRLHPERYGGVIQNGILLYGPQGTGKTFLAEATAGEFGINYSYVRPTELIERWMGAPEANVREVFENAAAYRPILLFIDEIDSLGSARQQIGKDGDPGGAGRAYNATTIQLMQSIDKYRNLQGFIIMAATNFLDAVDSALIRDGRFDVKERVDLPDERTIMRILEAQIEKKPHEKFPLEPFAARMPGASAARIKALVDRAAAIAVEQRRNIAPRDLERAMEETGGVDRPLFRPVDWGDVVISPDIEQDLRTLVSVLNNKGMARLDVEAPSGLLLIGPPGTGKTMLARLIATQTHRSFYPITPADVLGGAVGGSVKKMQEVFARAKEHAPSILFLDEIDGLLPRNYGQLNAHDVQLVEQTLMEITGLEPAHNVFLIGTTNHIDQIDARVLRGGRFGEKIEIGVPDTAGYRKLIERYMGRARLTDGLTVEHLIDQLQGVSPADLEGICKAAKRFAMRRLPEGGDELPPLEWDDFAQAMKRVQVQFS